LSKNGLIIWNLLKADMDFLNQKYSFIGEVIAAIYQYSLGIAGFLVFGSIVYAAILYTASAGNPTKQSEAKSRITSALFGLGLLLSAYLILYTINPKLVNLQDPGAPDPAPTVLPPNEISFLDEIEVERNIDNLSGDLKRDIDIEIQLKELMSQPNVSEETMKSYQAELQRIQISRAYNQKQVETYQDKYELLQKLNGLDKEIKNTRSFEEKVKLREQYDQVYKEYNR